MGVGGFEQVQAIAFWFGESLLMAKDNLVSVVVQLAECDETPAFFDLVGARDAETLGIGENAGVFLLDQNGLLAPCIKVAGGACVYILASLSIKEFGQSKDNANKVVGAALVISLLHGWGDLVVGLGDHVFKTNSRWIVAPRAEWIDICHAKACFRTDKAELCRSAAIVKVPAELSLRDDCIPAQMTDSGRATSNKSGCIRGVTQGSGPGVLISPSFSGAS